MVPTSAANRTAQAGRPRPPRLACEIESGEFVCEIIRTAAYCNASHPPIITWIFENTEPSSRQSPCELPLTSTTTLSHNLASLILWLHLPPS